MIESIPNTCGACLAFLGEGSDAMGPRGRCRLRPELGIISHTLPYCAKFVDRKTGATAFPAVKARGTVRRRSPAFVDTTPAPRKYGAHINLGNPGDDDMDTEALRALLQDVLTDHGVVGEIPIGGRWAGGTLLIKPASDANTPREMALESFFHKVVMLRDRLRVLEQKINTHPKLDESDKVEMQQYITRVYGSLTSFNFLFRDKGDYFVGTKSE